MDLKGKTINFLGDSITEGCGVTDIEANRYDNVIKRKCQLKKVNNYGIGGTRIAYQRHPSQKARYDQDFCARSYDMDKSADIIIHEEVKKVLPELLMAEGETKKNSFL